jgi:predicted nuclease of predicted toxin-antitoxin system
MSQPIKFIVDESTGSAVVQLLRQLSYDVLAVSEVMHQASDIDILNRAAETNRILITNDKDFGELIYRSGKVHAGVVLLRLSDESQASRVRVVKAVLEHHLGRLAGNFVVASEKRLRARPGKMPKTGES